jgi:hypothetical protein
MHTMHLLTQHNCKHATKCTRTNCVQVRGENLDQDQHLNSGIQVEGGEMPRWE